MKKAIVFVLLLFFASMAFSLNVVIPKGSYVKGEFLDFTGFASGNAEITFIGVEGNKNIGSLVASTDSNGFFSFNYFIPCTDPAGDWKMIVSDEKEKKEFFFRVNSSVQCEFMRVDFIEPSSSSYFSTQKFDVRVKITDAGNEVNNAESYFWDFNGNKRRLYFEGNGIYAIEGIEVPLNAVKGNWNLMVTAVSGGKEKNGGSNVVSFEVRSVPIRVNVVNPAVNEFSFGQPLELKVKPLYPDGSDASVTRVWAEFNGQKIDLKEEQGFFSAVIDTADFNAEVLYISIFAEDSFNNSGSVSLNLEPKGQLYFFIAQNAVVFLFPVIFVFYVLFVSVKEGRIFFNRTMLKRKRKKLLILMKKLQDDYFNRQIISREIYMQQYDDYKAELDAIESQMNELKSKQELK